MADVAGGEPALLQHSRGLLRIAPIAVHHIFAANHDLAVVRDPHFAILDRRANGFQPDADPRPVAADQRRRLGLPVALKESDPERLEKNTDFRVQWRAARHPGLLATAEAPPDLAPQSQ